MPDPAPLTDDEFAELQGFDAIMALEARLVATVEQTCRERDAAYACIRRWWEHEPSGWLPGEVAEWLPLYAETGKVEPMSPGEVDAVRRARAVPGAEEDQ